MRKQGIIRVTFKMLQDQLALSPGIEIEGAFMTIEDFQNNTISLKVSGDHPNLIETKEGEKIMVTDFDSVRGRKVYP